MLVNVVGSLPVYKSLNRITSAVNPVLLETLIASRVSRIKQTYSQTFNQLGG